MYFHPFDDFREARALGQTAGKLPMSNTYKIAQYKETQNFDITSASAYPTASVNFLVDDTKLMSIIIGQRLVALKLTPIVKPVAYQGAVPVAGEALECDKQMVTDWMRVQRCSLSVDGVEILNNQPIGALCDGFTFDPQRMPVPKNSVTVQIDNSQGTLTSSVWQDAATQAGVPQLIEEVVIGWLVELYYAPGPGAAGCAA